MKINKRIKRGIFTFALIGLVGAARASSYDVASDFSLSYGSPPTYLPVQNPNGPWSYGSYSEAISSSDLVLPGGENFNVFSSFRNLGNIAPSTHPDFTNLQEWYNGDPSTDPNVIYNSGSADVLTSPDFGDIDFRAGKMTLGPANGPTVVRFIAPKTGIYDILAAFTTVQVGNSAPGAYIYVGGSQKYYHQLVDPSSPLPAPQIGATADKNLWNVSLNSGEAVDFVVWGGSKTTELGATIIPVPLPASVGVGFGMLAGLGALFAVRKRLRRTPRIAV